MARHISALVFALTAASFVHAQPAPIDPPIAGRPVDFSNIVGKYQIRLSAAPTTVHVEESILLKIEIIGAGSPEYQPKRSSLKLIPASWDSDFFIQDLPSEDRVMHVEKTWLFAYRLKPKSAAVKAIPLITLSYYDPSQPVKNRFQKDYGGPIPITVLPKTDPPPIAVADDAMPPSFFARSSSDDVLRSTPVFELDVNRLLGWLVLPPIVCTIAIGAYRRSHPGQTELARRYHHDAAKRALARLGADSSWSVVAAYLQERFDYPALDGAPAEAAAFLKRRGFALALCRQSRAFFEACDAERFTQPSARADVLTAEAKRLIAALEADPCARG